MGPEFTAVVTALAQVGQPDVVDTAVSAPVQSVVSGAAGSFLLTLLLGGIMMGVWPGYTRARMETVRTEPVGSFVYGLLALVALIVTMVVFAVTVVGLVVAVPLAVFTTVVWAVGATISFLMVGDRIVGSEEGWLGPLVVGAAISGLLALTGIGGLVTFCLAAAGFGAVLRDW